MDGKYYSSERSVQLLISLLKQHGIKKIVASPGTTNLSFVASLQQDEWFEVYSSVVQRIWRVVWRRNRASPWC